MVRASVHEVAVILEKRKCHLTMHTITIFHVSPLSNPSLSSSLL